MDIQVLRESLQCQQAMSLDLYERRPGEFQLIIPILHEDGDMVDVYLDNSPLGNDYVRVCDFGMTLMRLSYTFELNTANRQQIFDNILINCGVSNDSGNLFVDTRLDRLYEGILQFAGCAQKVYNMRYWIRETTRNIFYDELNNHMTAEMKRFSPVPDLSPLPDFPNSVDWSLSQNGTSFYVFGVLGNDKAKNITISLLEFQKAELRFISLVVHESFEDLGAREQLLLTRNADKQYPALTDFVENGTQDIHRLAGASR